MGATEGNRSDADAWELYEANTRLIKHMAKMWSMDEAIADEMEHEAGEPALLRAAYTWDESRGWRFSTYACTCIRNAYVQWHRDRQRRGWTELPEWLPWDREQRDYDKLYESVAKLPHEQRLVVTMRYWGRATIRDVADELGMSVGRAHKVLREAHAALRVKMKGG